MKQMRIILVNFILFFIAVVTFSQTDSTTVYFKGIENKDLITICELADIQIEKIFCKDTLLRGKVFNVIIKEFKKGKIHSEKNLNITAEKRRIPMVVNGDTLIYIIDLTGKTGFGKSAESVTITFAGILKKNKFILKIEYPEMSINQELKGRKDYSLRTVNSRSGNMIRIPVNTEYPVLAYTPPFDTKAELKSYCILGEENVLDWYEKFKLKHYYVIYLEIK